MISRLIVVQSDPRVIEAVRFGFEREGASVVTATGAPEVESALGDQAQLIVAGASTGDEGSSLLRALFEAQVEPRVPVLYLGNGITREQALAAGASEFLSQPAFLRDVVTIGKLLASPAPNKTHAAAGELGDYFGLFYLVRALSAIRRTGVLTLVRGLRRGELRFFEGEVTSAQVGTLHGLAALHQLLLWTEAKFELRAESVVRRRQIPLEPDEVLQDAERFLSEIKAEAGDISPSSVYEQDLEEIGRAKEDIPAAVHPVLKLFDGHRSVADVIEDSPYRVFETLRIASRLERMGVIAKVAQPQSRAAARAALSIEEWLVGTGDAIPVPTQSIESEPVGPAPGEPASPPGKGKRKKKRGKKSRSRKGSGSEVAVVRPAPDWSFLGEGTRAEAAGYSPVVPSTVAAGEIVVGASRDAAPKASVERERLEQLTDPEQRDKIFPSDDQVAEVHGVRAAVDAEAADSAHRAADAEEAALREAQAIARRALEEARVTETERARAAEAAAIAEAEAAAVAVAATAAPVPVAASDAPTARLDPVPPAPAQRDDVQTDAVPRVPASSEVSGEIVSVRSTDRAVRERPSILVSGVVSHVESDAADAARAVSEIEEAMKSMPRESERSAKAKKKKKKRRKKKKGSTREKAGAPARSQPGAPKPKPAPEPAAPEPEPATEPEPVAAEPEPEPAPKPQPPVAVERPPEPIGAQREPAPEPQTVSGELQAVAAEPIAEPEPQTEPQTVSGELPEPVTEPEPQTVAGELQAQPAPAGGKDLKDSSYGEAARSVAESAARAADDAVHFTEDEEAFFQAGRELAQQAPPPVDSFEDLDHGYEPKSFWQRLLSKPGAKSVPKAQGRTKKKRR